MSKLYATAEELEAAAYDYGDILSKIENLEQSIIQHIRTSGMRQPRETALIDEVMELRRERRKFSTSIHGQLKATDATKIQLLGEVNDLRSKLHASESLVAELRNELARFKETERTKYDEKLQSELATQEEKLKFMEKINLAKLRNKYEERLKEVETKVQEAYREKAKGELKDAKTIALELVEKAKVELEKRCNERIEEYKKTIKALSEREEELRADRDSFKQHAATLSMEKKMFMDELKMKIEAGKLREQDLQRTNSTLQARLDALGPIEQKLADFIALKEREIEEITTRKEEEHQKHLAQVDDRIRRMLAAKDNELAQLRGVLRAKEAKLKAAEDSLALINQEIAAVRKR